MPDSDENSRYLKFAFVAGAILGLAIIAAIILAVVRFPVITAVDQAHWMQKQAPVLSKTPVPLRDITAEKAGRTSISAFGWTCEAPWVPVATIKTTRLVERIVFKNGKSIGVFDPNQTISTAAGIARTLEEQGSHTQLEAELGKDTMGSGYELELETLQITPQDFSVFMSNKRARRGAVLLFFKYMTVHDANTELFSFSFENLHGFQYGDPARARGVEIHGYDWQGHSIQVSVGMGDGQQDHVLQSEINRVLQTLHWIGDTGSP